MYGKNLEVLRVSSQDLRDQHKELLNRIQAKDFATFVALQNDIDFTKNELYYPRNAEGEAAQVNDMYSKYGAYAEEVGLGETLFDRDPATELQKFLVDEDIGDDFLVGEDV